MHIFTILHNNILLNKIIYLNYDLRNENAPLAKLQSPIFVMLVLGVVFVTYQIIGGIFSLLIVGTDSFADAKSLNITRYVVMGGEFMLILVPVIVLNMLRGDTYKAGFKIYKPDYTILILGILGVIVVQPFLQYFVIMQNKLLFSLPFGQNVIQEMKKLYDMLEETTTKLVMSYSVSEFIVVTLVIAVTPAICEEFLFRGIVLGNLQDKMKPMGAVILTGILFAGYHFHPFNLLPLAVLGIYISLVAYWGGSIIPAIVVHFTNNFISAYAVFIYGKEFMSDTEMTGSEMLNYGLVAAGSLIIFIIILYFMGMIYKKKNVKVENV